MSIWIIFNQQRHCQRLGVLPRTTWTFKPNVLVLLREGTCMLFMFITEESGGKHTCVCQVEWEKWTDGVIVMESTCWGTGWLCREHLLDSQWEAGSESPLAFKTKNQSGLKIVGLLKERRICIYKQICLLAPFPPLLPLTGEFVSPHQHCPANKS